MIPDIETIEKHKQEVREGLLKRGIDYPKDWKIDIKVEPYLGYDIRYGFGTKEEPNEKRLWFHVYSARYPATWYKWIDASLDEIVEYITNKILAKEIPNIIIPEVRKQLKAILDASEQSGFSRRSS